MKLTEIFNICNTCVYAPCLCGNEPENCVAYVERIGYNMDGSTDCDAQRKTAALHTGS